MTPKEILVAARKLIERPECWGQGFRRGGAHCADTAVQAIADSTNGLFVQRRAALDAALQFLDAASPIGDHIDYNDAFDTTHADVLAMYDRAIELAAQRESKS